MTPAIEFEPESHVYTVGGTIMPSVSSILAATLANPYAGVDARTLEIAADRGRRVDELLCQLLADVALHDVEDEIQPYLQSYVRWVQATGYRTLTTHQRMHDAELGVCGELDEVGWLNGRLTLIDWKCMAQCQERTRYQIAAYARMWSLANPRLLVSQGRALLLDAKGGMAKAVPVDLAIYGPQWVRLCREYGRAA